MADRAPELKMWLVVRKDIDMPRPKAMAQAGHGFLSCALKAAETHSIRLSLYQDQAQPKIVVGAKNLDALERAHRECEEAGLPVSPIIVDAARTHFTEPTATVFAVGPCFRDELPKFVGRLQVLAL